MSTSRSRGADPLDERLRALAGVAKQAGIFCDFDGTLSAIVPFHEDARAVRGAGVALSALARRFAVVAVISGRNLSSLSHRLRVPGVLLLGLYGLEERIGRRTRAVPEAEAQRPAIRRAAAMLAEKIVSFDGVRIERKGLAVAVHVRQADDPDEAQRLVEPVVHAIAASERLDVLVGRRVLELRPRVPVDKGRVVSRLVAEQGLRGALVAGDDAGDVPMFVAVDGLEHAARVAVASIEAPAELLARADRAVGSPAELVRLLRALASAAGR